MIIEAIKHCKIQDEHCNSCPIFKEDNYICINVRQLGEEFAEMLIKELESEVS
jgi:hypothetical protein